MALNKEVLKQGIIGLSYLMLAQEDQDHAIQLFAEEMSTLLDNYVRGGQVVGATSDGAAIVNGQIV
ncbi:hypothetical protein KORDIASMS9_02669 [Kordia sp. SMS9]|uniref:hypothetical protein n=1 Tax=Kordia sp. SMS9 TaxID=2282170 RepID=UPI000E0D0E1E|nr:hypothetical protein [Kordia sp. SMS9]AXG70429.1 hypothetical protein KORDIASMS9_02669 [Kordia sp. SMS9]